MSNDIYRYYVYAYLRTNGTPYYIGKGCNNRAYTKHRHISVPKNKSRIVFLETHLSNVGACALERRYILWYGRKNTNTGILINLTDGGEGCEGHIHSEETKARISDQVREKTKGIPKSSEHRTKLSDALKGKAKSSEHRAKLSAINKGENNPNYGKKRSLETRAKQSSAMKGRKLTSEHRAKLSTARKGKIPWNKGKASGNKRKPA